MTARTAEYPGFHIVECEQANLLTSAAVAAGALATQKHADVYIDLAVSNGWLTESPDPHHVIVHGMALDHNQSLILRSDGHRGATSSLLRSRTRDVSGRPHETVSWLEQGDGEGELNRVFATVDDVRQSTVTGREPASLETVTDMLQVVRGGSDDLPAPRPPRDMRGGSGGHDLFLIPSERLVPAVMHLTEAVGTALQRPIDCQYVKGHIKYTVGSAGRVYSLSGNALYPNEISLSVMDPKQRKRMKFAMQFRFADMHYGDESSFVKCALITDGPGKPITVETLGMRGDRLWVTPNHIPKSGYEPDTNGVDDLARKAIDFIRV